MRLKPEKKHRHLKTFYNNVRSLSRDFVPSRNSLFAPGFHLFDSMVGFDGAPIPNKLVLR
ncbi:hypothetical protein EMIT093MI4_230021 [Pseudomonas sp. IT-93MI4]